MKYAKVLEKVITLIQGNNYSSCLYYDTYTEAKELLENCGNGKITPVLVRANDRVEYFNGCSDLDLEQLNPPGYKLKELDNVEIGTIYDDPESRWQVIKVSEGFVDIKDVAKGSSNYGNEFTVPIEEVIYYSNVTEEYID